MVEKVGQVALPAGSVHEGQVVSGPAVTNALRQLRQGLGIGHTDVILGCEHLRSFAREVTVPWVPVPQRQQALPLVATEELQMAPDDAVVDFVELDESVGDDGGRVMRGLLVAASTEALTMEIMAVEAAGFRVSRVDLSALALVRSVGNAAAGPPAETVPDADGAPVLPTAATEAIVDVGAGLTTVVIHDGGVPRFVRLLPPTERSAIARLVEEIRSSFDYCFKDEPEAVMGRVVLTGGWASEELVERLGTVVKAPVTIESAFRNVDAAGVGLTREQVEVMSATGAVCIGLALGEAP